MARIGSSADNAIAELITAETLGNPHRDTPVLLRLVLTASLASPATHSRTEAPVSAASVKHASLV